jgi:hypothetical protein
MDLGVNGTLVTVKLYSFITVFLPSASVILLEGGTHFSVNYGYFDWYQ